MYYIKSIHSHAQGSNRRPICSAAQDFTCGSSHLRAQTEKGKTAYGNVLVVKSVSDFLLLFFYVDPLIIEEPVFVNVRVLLIIAE